MSEIVRNQLKVDAGETEKEIKHVKSATDLQRLKLEKLLKQPVSKCLL